MLIIIIQMLDVWDNITEWYHNQPFFTRTYLSVCILFTILISLNLISSYHLFYTFEATFFKLHIWRPLTAFLFIEKLDAAFVVSLYVLYFSLNRLERQIVTGEKYAEFLWMILLLLISCIVIGTIMDVYFLSDMFITAIVYLSARKTPSEYLHIVFNINIETSLLPYAYFALMLIFGHQVITEVVGLLLGMCYFALQQKGHKQQSKNYIKPPSFLIPYCQSFIGDRNAE